MAGSDPNRWPSGELVIRRGGYKAGTGTNTTWPAQHTAAQFPPKQIQGMWDEPEPTAMIPYILKGFRMFLNHLANFAKFGKKQIFLPIYHQFWKLKSSWRLVASPTCPYHSLWGKLFLPALWVFENVGTRVAAPRASRVPTCSPLELPWWCFFCK